MVNIIVNSSTASPSKRSNQVTIRIANRVSSIGTTVANWEFHWLDEIRQAVKQGHAVIIEPHHQANNS
jgi:hypothetical protein